MTIGFWTCVLIVGILQSLQGQGVGDFTAIVAILGAIEHILAGKTTAV